jgi:hypothetical protein
MSEVRLRAIQSGNPQPSISTKIILEHPHVDTPIMGHSFRKSQYTSPD